MTAIDAIGTTTAAVTAASSYPAPPPQMAPVAAPAAYPSGQDPSKDPSSSQHLPPPPPPPPPAARGEASALQDPAKLDTLSSLLGVDPSDLTAQATDASSLVSMLQSNNVDQGTLKSVLGKGDIFDLTA